MSQIIVFAEHENGKVKKTAFELLSKAQSLAPTLGAEVNAVVLGAQVSGLSDQLAAYGAKKVYVAESAELNRYNTEGYTTIISELIKAQNPVLVLSSASAAAKDFFPRVAARLKAGLASEVTDIKVSGSDIVATRPIYAGKAFVDVSFKTPVKLITVRPNSFPVAAPASGGSAQTVSISADMGAVTLTISEIVQGKSDKPDLTEAERIVSGGRSLGSAENFKILTQLADAIGATVGASRAAVDSGYASHDMQVGQTGKVVNPSLYIACGVSGAIQHQAGMRTSKVIVAVNKDPEAAIFKLATYGIVGDLFEVVPLLTQEFKRVLSE